MVEESVVLVVMMNRTVLDQTSGLETSVLITWWVNHSPVRGWRRWMLVVARAGGMIQETAAACRWRRRSRSRPESWGRNAFWYNADDGLDTA